MEEIELSNHHLEARRFTGHGANTVNHVEQIIHGADVHMAVGADGVASLFDTPDLGDLSGHLTAGKNAAFAGLRTLAHLDFEHAHLFVSSDLAQLVVVQVALLVAHAVLRRADLEHDVATTLEVIGREAALAGVHPDAGLTRAFG